MTKQIQHFAFYLGAVSFVIILFTVATSYGEANLKTVSKIDGIYLVESGISNCGDNLQLVMQQSGIYINAAIAPIGDDSKGSSELSGKWQGQKLLLSGNSSVCKSLVAIAATVESTSETKQIIGKIEISHKTSDFTATQVKITEEKKSNSH